MNAELESTVVNVPNRLHLVSGPEPSPESFDQLCHQLCELATYQGGVRNTNHNVELKDTGFGMLATQSYAQGLQPECIVIKRLRVE